MRTPLQKYLHDSGETGRAFARRVGIHYSRISRYLSGKAAPGRETAVAIEAATRGAVSVVSWRKRSKPQVAARKAPARVAARSSLNQQQSSKST